MITCVAAKISIIIALLRITVDRIHAYILYSAMVLATAVGLIFFFFTIFQCRPVDFFWNRAQEGASGKCVSNDVLIGIAYLYSVGAAITDLTIGLLPVALIWNLRMNTRTKCAIVGILGIGCMYVIPRQLMFFFNFYGGELTPFQCKCRGHHSNSLRSPLQRRGIFMYVPRSVEHSRRLTNADNTYQISIWSNIEAGLGITAGCLTTLRPLVRFLRDGSSAGPSRTPPSFPLASNVAGGFHRSTRSKHESRDDARQLWTGTDNDDYHGVTTTIMGHTNVPTSSEEDLHPHRAGAESPGWKVERSVRVSVRNS